MRWPVVRRFGLGWLGLGRAHATDVPDETDGIVRWRVWARWVRARWLITRRLIGWRLRPSQFAAPVAADPAATPVLVHAQRVTLSRTDPFAAAVLEEGKRHNVALAAPRLDGIALAPGAVFSFWRAVGRVQRSRGYRYGMEVRGGCVVPSLGGGLCLLSNALFRAAVICGWEIVERHGHTMEAIPSTDDPWGVDATIAWPYVDLRFSVPAGDPPARLAVRVVDDAVEIQVWSTAPLRRTSAIRGVDDATDTIDGVVVRRNRLVRTMVDGAGAVVEDIVATNEKRIVPVAKLGRSCLDCGKEHCAARVTIR